MATRTFNDNGLQVDIPGVFTGSALTLSDEASAYARGRPEQVANPAYAEWQASTDPDKGDAPPTMIDNPQSKSDFAGQQTIRIWGEDIKRYLYHRVANSNNLQGMSPTEAMAACDAFLNGADGAVEFTSEA